VFCYIYKIVNFLHSFIPTVYLPQILLSIYYYFIIIHSLKHILNEHIFIKYFALTIIRTFDICSINTNINGIEILINIINKKIIIYNNDINVQFNIDYNLNIIYFFINI